MITNKKQSSRVLLIFTSISAGLIIIFALSFLELFASPLWIRIALAGLIGLVALFFAFGGFYFIRVEVENNSDLMVKYYNLFPAGRKFRAFKIPLSQLHHHEIQQRYGGLTQWLLLFQKMQGGIAKYPAVGFSATNNALRQEIEEYLKKLEKKR